MCHLHARKNVQTSRNNYCYSIKTWTNYNMECRMKNDRRNLVYFILDYFNFFVICGWWWWCNTPSYRKHKTFTIHGAKLFSYCRKTMNENQFSILNVFLIKVTSIQGNVETSKKSKVEGGNPVNIWIPKKCFVSFTWKLNGVLSSERRYSTNVGAA